jgi:hypothetical protein
VDGAAERRTTQDCLPFPLCGAFLDAPVLHCKRASPAERFALSRLQAAHPADRDHAQPSGFG